MSEAPVRLGWGWAGAREAARRGNALVVVDVLSFSSAVATAVAQGGAVYPYASQEDAAVLAAELGAELAVMRWEVPERGRFSLSPPTFLALEPGGRVVLPSPNGATCCGFGAAAPLLLVGCLLNARAVARAAAGWLEGGGTVTVLAAGERRKPDEDGPLRFALEDYLGAGAILARLPGNRTPEAELCASAFGAARPRLEALLLGCESGLELIERGFETDVTHSARLNAYDVAPGLRDGRLEALG